MKEIMLTKVIGSPTELSFGLEKIGLKPVIESFIDIEFTKWAPPLPRMNWIFFSSANAVRGTLQNQSDLSAYKIACIGRGTAAALPAEYSIDFIGESADTSKVATKFAEIAQKETVLFPISSISNRTIQKQLKESQVHEIVVYQTLLKPRKVDSRPFLVFSSPSQWDGFKMSNKTDENQKIFAFGKTTEAAIRAAGAKVDGVLKDISVNGLISTIKEHVRS